MKAGVARTKTIIFKNNTGLGTKEEYLKWWKDHPEFLTNNGSYWRTIRDFYVIAQEVLDDESNDR